MTNRLKQIFIILILSASLIPRTIFAESNSDTSLQSYIIKLNSNNPEILQTQVKSVEPKFKFTENPAFKNIFRVSSDLSLSEIKTRLNGQFEYVEVDQTILAKADITLNDPGFTNNAFDTEKQWGLAKAKFPAAWNKSTGANSVVVAIIDTGVDATHEDLEAQTFVKGFNFLTQKDIAIGTNSDNNGHGTLVAGIIGAKVSNNLGVAGGAWQVTLMPIKALDSNGSGSSSDISEAMVWATDHGASIINMSLGGLGFSHDTTLSNAVSYAFNKNVVLVAAAGNDVAINGGNVVDNPVFPICADNGENMIIGVTATDNNDLKATFANYGKNCVDVSAPGRRILSTINYDPVIHVPAPDAYAYASGTSMAVPYVTAQAVLLKAAFPLATNRQIRDRIISTADPIDVLNPVQCEGLSCSGLLGAGRINVEKSLQKEIAPYIQEGDLVKLNTTGQLFHIYGGKRHPIFPFVFHQRFAVTTPKIVTELDLATFPEGQYAEPVDGTLIKTDSDPTVFYMSKGLKFGVTAQMFKLYNFADFSVNSITTSEINSWITAGLLPPPDGSLVRTEKNQTVYWTVGGVLHPINNNFFISRGLNIFPVIYVSDQDLKNFSKGESYIL